MAKRTYLQLANDFLDEYGVGGGGPILDVTGQTGELGRAVRWIRDANEQILNRWFDWRFLWKLWEGELSVGTVEPTLPTVASNGYEFLRYDRESFYLDYGGDTRRRLTPREWRTYRHEVSAGLRVSTPSYITELPDRTLRVNALAERDFAFSCEGWKRPKRLAANGDVSDIPENYERIIIVTAAMLYADHHDAPEILESASAEHLEILDKLESAELPERDLDRMAAQDEPLIIDVPGMESRRSVTR